VCHNLTPRSTFTSLTLVRDSFGKTLGFDTTAEPSHLGQMLANRLEILTLGVAIILGMIRYEQGKRI